LNLLAFSSARNFKYLSITFLLSSGEYLFALTIGIPVLIENCIKLIGGSNSNVAINFLSISSLRRISSTLLLVLYAAFNLSHKLGKFLLAVIYEKFFSLYSLCKLIFRLSLIAFLNSFSISLSGNKLR